LIPPESLVENTRLNPINAGQIAIQHDGMISYGVNLQIADGGLLLAVVVRFVHGR
jgi:hypothetical protein